MQKIIEGIPVLSADRYWGKAPRAELERALSLIETEGWEAFKTQFEGKFDFTFEESRADWRFSLPIDRSWRVLDAGAGMGRSSIPLARVAGSVVALDQSLLRMKFLKKRAETEGLSNIEPYVGDLFDAETHFPSESFDLIAMNGLLEWIGRTDRYRSPREAQIAALALCHRLLKPGGYLYIGIENRFALAYLNARDHSGLRFTSYMPRWLANLYTRLRKGERYDTYTYTVGGYCKLLREGGFSEADFYLVYPGYNAPRILIPYKDLGMLSYVIQELLPGNSSKHQLVKAASSSSLLLAAYRTLFFSFNIFVQK